MEINKALPKKEKPALICEESGIYFGKSPFRDWKVTLSKSNKFSSTTKPIQFFLNLKLHASRRHHCIKHWLLQKKVITCDCSLQGWYWFNHFQNIELFFLFLPFLYAEDMNIYFKMQGAPLIIKIQVTNFQRYSQITML